MAEEKTTTVHKIVIWAMIGVIAFLSCYIIYLNKKVHTNIETIETMVTQDNKYTQFYYEREFKALQKENKELYDSLKHQKDYITSLQQFQYQVKFLHDTVYTTPEIPEIVKDLPNETFVYQEETDSLSYELQVNAKVEPNWYLLNVGVKDMFTIVSKEFADGRMETTIESEHHGEIDNITAWQKSSRRKWYQRFSVGPSITVGYDIVNRNLGAMVGFSVTYDLLGK